MSDRLVNVERRDGVFLVAMNDPASRNSMSPAMTEQVSQALDEFERDRDLRVLLLTGSEISFCSGGDVRVMNQTAESLAEAGAAEPLLDDAWEQLELALAHGGLEEPIIGPRLLPLRISQLHKPSIAAVNGYAVGLGMGLALACDIRIASEQARFSEAMIRRGLIPADGSCWQLPRMIGLGNTLLLQYTGDMIDAAEAYRLGIVNKVTPHGDLIETALELASRLAHGPTYAMSLTKRLVQKSLEIDFAGAVRLANVVRSIAGQTEDHLEGTRAFLEKRKPEFKGR